MKLVAQSVPFLCISDSSRFSPTQSRGGREEDCNQSWRNKHLSTRDDKKSQRARTLGFGAFYPNDSNLLRDGPVY